MHHTFLIKASKLQSFLKTKKLNIKRRSFLYNIRDVRSITLRPSLKFYSPNLNLHFPHDFLLFFLKNNKLHFDPYKVNLITNFSSNIFLSTSSELNFFIFIKFAIIFFIPINLPYNLCNLNFLYLTPPETSLEVNLSFLPLIRAYLLKLIYY
jgi:hypothetical protein